MHYSCVGSWIIIVIEGKALYQLPVNTGSTYTYYKELTWL